MVSKTPNDPVEEIKNRLDIKEIVGEYLKLEKSGANFRALCPFHKEKTPSFFVSPSRQLWRCFGCGEGGDILSFIQDIEGVDFPEALRTLAKRAGIELTRQDPRARTERARSFELCELVAKYFHHQLDSKNGRVVKNYLEERGINKESIEAFQLGYAPHSSRQLLSFLREKGYKPRELEQAGIAYPSKRGGMIGRFRGRIIFPIRDPSGRVTAFGARKLTRELAQAMGREYIEDTAKYINSPQTNIYDKSGTLYGLDAAKMAIRHEDACVVAEGYTDVILAHQKGYQNVVAASGTALTERQLTLIKRFTGTLLTAFDMDIAGDTATRRGIDMAQELGFDVKIIPLPHDADPADILEKDTKQWEQAVAEAKSVVQFYIDSAIEKFDASSADGKRDIVRSVAPVLKSIASRVEQAHWVQTIAQNIHIEEAMVWDDIQQAEQTHRRQKPAPEQQKQSKPRVSRKELLAQHLLLHALGSRKRMEKALQIIPKESDLLPARVLHALKESSGTPEKAVAALPQQERTLAEQLLMEREVRDSDDLSRETFTALCAEWEKLTLDEEKADLQRQIAQAERDSEDPTPLIHQLQQVSDRRFQLDKQQEV